MGQIPFKGSDRLHEISYSGPDVLAYAYIPILEDPRVREAPGANERGQLLGTLQTISITSTRSVTPVRTLGRASPMGYSRGGRTFAGTLVFATLDRDPFSNIYRPDAKHESLLDSGTSLFVDQLPPFTVVITAANELGGIARQVVAGITLINYGVTYSIDDIYTETTYCVDEETEALTTSGWKKYQDIREEDQLLTINPDTQEITWQDHTLHTFDYDGPMVHWQNYRGVDFLTTPNHRWMTIKHHQWNKHKETAPSEFMETKDIEGKSVRVRIGGGTPNCFADTAIYSDEFVELVGWVVTEGTRHYTSSGRVYAYTVSQSAKANPCGVGRIRDLASHYSSSGVSVKERSRRDFPDQKEFYFGKGIAKTLDTVIPNRSLTPQFLTCLTHEQAKILAGIMIYADGSISSKGGQTVFLQNKGQNSEMFQMLTSMLGKRTTQKYRNKDESSVTVTNLYRANVINGYSLEGKTINYKGTVWCPRTKNSTWLARRNGCTFWTGNTYVAQDVMPLLPDNKLRGAELSPSYKRASDVMASIYKAGEVGSPWPLWVSNVPFEAVEDQVLTEKGLEADSKKGAEIARGKGYRIRKLGYKGSK